MAKHKSFTPASKELNICQPTVSLQVHEMEKHCSCALLIRKSKDVELTKEGQILFSYAEKIFGLATELERVVADFRDLRLETLKIGLTILTVKDLAPRVIRNLKKKYPDIKIQLFIGTAKEIIEKVVNFEYHIAITGRLIYPDNIVYKHLQKVKLYFITADKEIKEKIHLRDLANYPLILPADRVSYRKIIIDELKTRNIPTNIYVEILEPSTLKSLVSMGLGGAFMPLDSVEQDIKEGKFRGIETFEEIHFDYDLIYRKERRNSKSIQSILAAIDEVER